MKRIPLVGKIDVSDWISRRVHGRTASQSGRLACVHDARTRSARGMSGDEGNFRRDCKAGRALTSTDAEGRWKIQQSAKRGRYPMSIGELTPCVGRESTRICVAMHNLVRYRTHGPSDRRASAGADRRALNQWLATLAGFKRDPFRSHSRHIRYLLVTITHRRRTPRTRIALTRSS